MAGSGARGRDDEEALGDTLHDTPSEAEREPAEPHGVVGRVLGDFEVRGRLGEGGFGVVYRATQRTLGREAVVKVLHRRHRARGPGAERFLREAKLASRLEHPYAAHIYAFGAEPDGLLWIAMELARGRSLDQLISLSGPMPAERFVPLLERICEVVHTAHSQGIVHRDLKPANVIVLARAGRLLPKLLDFGIAKLARDQASSTEEGAPRGSAEWGAEQSEAPSDDDEELTPPPTMLESPARPLTMRGAVVGSPPYMAPEQWTNAQVATRQTDQYALAILTYQCLSGSLPFVGGLTEVARGHCRTPLPSVSAASGGRVPLALDAVLARGAAKQAADRYPNVLELARAVRVACGLGEERETLPQLPDDLRELAERAWPQPLAESLARLHAARNPHQAHDACERLTLGIARWFGACALAARLQVGPGGVKDSPAAIELLRGLRRGAPDAPGWSSLARELTRGFQGREAAHPLPGLVTALAAGDPLAEVHAALVAATGTGEELVRESLRRAVEALGRAFVPLAFLAEQRVGLVTPEGVESWSGLARLAREVGPHPPRELADGAVILLEGEAPGLVLTPFAQVAPPLPGAPRELFVFAGGSPSGRGARLVADPAGYEREDPAIWETTGQLLPGDDPELPGSSRDDHPPYAGLAPFTREQADRFFGRDEEVTELANRVRASAFVTVAGASGAGKSSLILAGLLPRLPNDWRVVVMRPGAAPSAALAAALGLTADADLAAELRETVSLLVVDQLEELVTLTSDDEERRRFAELLAPAPTRVLVTVRDDLLARVASLPKLRAALGASLVLLTTPGRDELRRILALPARAAGYVFEDETLVDEMIAAVGEKAGALALLSFTAAEMWRLRDRNFRHLSRKSYQALGGVGGALGQHAESVLAGMGVAEREAVRHAFRALVTEGGTRVVMARAALRHVLGGEARADRVIEALIGARLLQASESPRGDDQVELIHEALIGAWPRLAEWRREDAEGARLRDQVRSAAAQWDQRGRPDGLLWRADALAEMSRWRRQYASPLTPVEEAFARASEEDSRSARRRRRVLVGVAFAALAVAAGVLAWQRGVALRAKETAQDVLLYQYEEQGRRALLDGDPLRAAPYLLAAYSGGRDTPALRFLLGSALASFEAEERRFDHGDAGRIYAAAFGAGDTVVTGAADGTVRIWDRGTGALRTRFADEEEAPIYALALSADGSRLVVGGVPGSIWKSDGTLVARLGETPSTGLWVEIDPGDRRVVTAEQGGVARLWELSTGKLRATLSGHEGNVRRAHFSPDGTLVVTAAEDATAAIWRVETGERVVRLAGHTQAVRDAAFSPDGAEVATASRDGTAAVYSATTGARRLSLAGRGNTIEGVAFASSGEILLAYGDGGVTIWEVKTGNRRCDLAGTRGAVAAARFDPEGTRVVAGTREGGIVIWDADSCAELGRLAGHVDMVWSVAWDRDGAGLLSAGFDGTARLWRIADGRRIGRPGAPLRAAAWFADGETRLTVTDGGVATVWGKDGEALRTVEHGGAAEYAETAPQGEDFVIAGRDGRITIWREGAPATLDSGPGVVWVARHSPDGRRLLVVKSAPDQAEGRDSARWQASGEISLWDLGDLRREARGASQAIAAAFTPDGHLVTSDLQSTVIVLRDPAFGELRTLRGAEDLARWVDVRGDLVVSGGGGVFVTLTDWRTGREIARLRSSNVTSFVTADAQARLVATASRTARSLTVWDPLTGHELAQMGGVRVVTLDWSRDGKRLVLADESGLAQVLPTPRETRSPEALAPIVRCHSPHEVVGGTLRTSTVPACPR